MLTGVGFSTLFQNRIREKYTEYYERKRMRVKPEGDRKVKRIRFIRVASEPNLATLFYFSRGNYISFYDRRG